MMSETTDKDRENIVSNIRKEFVTTNQRVKYSDTYSQNSFDSISAFERERLLERFKFIYGQIVFDCFSSVQAIDNKIDSFVREAFLVNLPRDMVIKMHMELMENLEHQLPLESLRSDYLSNFNSVLVNVITHLDRAYPIAIG